MLISLLLFAQVSFPLRHVHRVPEPTPQVEFAPTGRVAVKWYTLSLVGTAPTNGDNDGYADADETLDMTLSLVNGPLALTNLVVTITTGDATIAPRKQIGASVRRAFIRDDKRRRFPIMAIPEISIAFDS